MPPHIRTLPGRGQHFLRDQSYISRIIECAGIDSNESAIEIGPGYGALTFPLCSRAARLVAIEWDKRLVEFLKESSQQPDERLRIIQADVMRLDFGTLLDDLSAPPIVLGNLPYYVATSLIQRLLPLGQRIKRMVFMVQREVAERMTAMPSTKSYGYLTLVVRYYAHVERCIRVPPQAFKPRPKIESEVIRLVPRSKPAVSVENQALLFRLIKAAFTHRRKTLINSLMLDPFFGQTDIQGVCDAQGLDRRVRPEALTLDDYARLLNRDSAHLIN